MTSATAALPPRPRAVIDAHHHLWDLRNDLPWLKDEVIPFRYGDYSTIRRDYAPADYRADTAGWPIAGTVYVEAEWNRSVAADEVRWVGGVAEREGFPNAMVAWCDPAAPDAVGLLERHAAAPIVRGVRHKPAAAASPVEARRGAPGSMDDPRWREGYAHLERLGLSFDLQTPFWHLDAAAELCADVPGVPLILNHTGLPADRSADGLRAWRAAMERLAAQPNAAVKISGLGLAGRRWSAEENAGVIRDAIAIFGCTRAMFASNFPVDGIIGDFNTIFRGFLGAVADRTDEERDGLFHDNAVRLYRLGGIA